MFWIGIQILHNKRLIYKYKFVTYFKKRLEDVPLKNTRCSRMYCTIFPSRGWGRTIREIMNGDFIVISLKLMVYIIITFIIIFKAVANAVCMFFFAVYHITDSPASTWTQLYTGSLYLLFAVEQLSICSVCLVIDAWTRTCWNVEWMTDASPDRTANTKDSTIYRKPSCQTSSSSSNTARFNANTKGTLVSMTLHSHTKLAKWTEKQHKEYIYMHFVCSEIREYSNDQIVHSVLFARLNICEKNWTRLPSGNNIFGASKPFQLYWYILSVIIIYIIVLFIINGQPLSTIVSIMPCRLTECFMLS